MVCFTK
jgi:hypothetical protein